MMIMMIIIVIIKTTTTSAVIVISIADPHKADSALAVDAFVNYFI